MKKLIILTMVLMMFAVSPSTQKVGAGTESIIWDDCADNLIEGYVEILPDTKSITVGLPNYGDALANLKAVVGDKQFSFTFSDTGSATEVVLFNTATNDGEAIVYDLYDTSKTVNDYVINFDAYNIPDNVNRLDIDLPVTTCSEDLNVQIYVKTRYSYTYDDLDYGRIAFAIYPDMAIEGSTNTQDFYVTNFIEIPPNTSYINMILGVNFITSAQEDSSVMYYYNEDKEVVFIDDVFNDTGETTYHDWYDTSVFGDLSVAWSFWGFDQSNAVKYIRLGAYKYNDNYGMMSVEQWNRKYVYYLDDQSVTTNFIVDGEIYETYKVVAGSTIIRSGLTPAIEGKTFDYWVDSNNNVWENGGSITDDMISGNIANIYAVYIDDKEVINPDVDDPTPDGGSFEVLLDDVGFNDAPERVIVFSLVLLAVSIILLGMKVELFNILIVDAIITAFFISLGLLPAFVTIIIIIVLIFFAWRFMMGGGGSNE